MYSLLLHWQVLEKKRCVLCFWRAPCTAKQKFYTSSFSFCASKERAENDQFLKRCLTTWLRWRGTGPMSVGDRSCRNVLERWVQRNRCENFPQLMVTCTDDCQHRAGLAACQPLTTGSGVLQEPPPMWEEEQEGCLELVGWEECEVCLTCSAISNPNQSCIAWQATQIEKSWCLQGLRMDEGKGSQLCVLLGAAQEDTQIWSAKNLGEAWSGACGENIQTFARLPWSLCVL